MASVCSRCVPAILGSYGKRRFRGPRPSASWKSLRSPFRPMVAPDATGAWSHARGSAMSRPRDQMDAANQVVRPLDPLGNERDQVLRLYRANRVTLGFFPQGALDEFIGEGCVLVAVADGAVVGYLAYRVSRGGAKIVHLCVDVGQRGQGVARSLADELFRETAHLEDVRLLCREDYPLNGFWPRLGFVCANEKVGRSKAGKKLFLWVRRNVTQPPILAAIDAAARANRLSVVVDANVFYDFDGTDEQAQESQGLLADWLADDAAICLTAEIKNEISRHTDMELRARRRCQIEEFTVLEATPDRLMRY
jgi:ribosomal protein S18 acetylase RimI-like enzyme